MEIVTVDNENSNPIVIGTQITALLDRQNKLSQQEKDTLLEESVEIMSKCTSTGNQENFDTGLIFGYVQSGKTLSFTSVIALAKDNEFRMVIILAGTKNNLLTQTTDRIKTDLMVDTMNKKHFKVLENPSAEQHTVILKSLLSQRRKPLIVLTMLKHGGRIDNVATLLSNSDIQEKLGSQPVLIIDDEADQASLNILERKNSRNGENEESRTFESIYNLRQQFVNHTFLQYTATPQGPLLIDIMNTLSPDFHKVLTPGLSYTGGQAFFESEHSSTIIVRIPEDEVYHPSQNPLISPPPSLISALEDFFISSAIHIDLLETENLLSMMIHPSHIQDSNRLFKGWVDDIIEMWKSIFELSDSDIIKQEFISKLTKKISTIMQECGLDIGDSPVDPTQVLDLVHERLLDTMTHLVIGGELEVEWSLSSNHILIGGAKLDRGFTVKGLITTYMPRNTLSFSNADTIQQRCRFFGYKKPFLRCCRVYLPENSIAEYEAYVEHEEHLRSVLQTCTTSEFSRRFILGGNLRPTRSSILADDLLRLNLSGAKQLSAIKEYKNNEFQVTKLLDKYSADLANPDNVIDRKTEDRTHRFFIIQIEDALQFLYSFKLTSAEDIELKSMTIEYLLYHRDTNNVSSCKIIEMAFSRENPRRRTLSSINRINNIFTGRSTSGEAIYEGDRLIGDENMLTIQIHRIELKSEEYPMYHGRIINTLGFIFPANLNLSFVGT